MIANYLLTTLGRIDHYSSVPDKEGNGFDRLTYKKAHNGAMPFFYVRMLSSVPFMGGGGREARACRFSFLYRSTNPVTCCPPHLVVGRGFIAHKRG
jgi:hypothetical protein